MKKNFFKNLISIVLLVIAALIIFKKENVNLIFEISIFELLLSIIVCLIIFSISGFKIRYLTSTQLQTKIKLIDTITLPLMMNLSSFLIPIKGGMIYLILFLKMKYKLRISGGITISAYTHSITLALYGLIGIVYLILSENLFTIAALVALILLFNPLVIKLFSTILNLISFKNPSFLKITHEIISSTIDNLIDLWCDIKSILALLLLACFHTFFRTLWIYLASKFFDMNISFISIITMALLTELSIIIRFVPGNLGVYELVSGGAFKLLGEPIETGILLALFLRFTVSLVTFTLGLLAFYMNLKFFKIKDLKSLWQKLKNYKYSSDNS